MANVAILGLSGDPPHLGHLAVAEAVHAMGYTRVWFMITPQSPFKTNVTAPYWHRRELARMLTFGHQSWLEVSDFEAGVSVEDPNFRTYTVLTDLKSAMPSIEFTFVMGADAWADEMKGFHTWSHFQDIPDRAGLLILPREPWTEQALTCPAAQFLCSRQCTGHGAVPTGMWRLGEREVKHPASSTAVREALEAGETSEYLTPEQNAYALAHGLYR